MPGPMTRDIEETHDVVVVGGGFSGCCALHLLRKAGFDVVLLEASEALGGIWTTSRYPGARVDCEMPWYGFSDPLVWETWTWRERFPDAATLRVYFQHLAEVWQLHDFVRLQTYVVSAAYLGEDAASWIVQTNGGLSYRCRWLVMACGTSSKPYIPRWKGDELFQGLMCHSSQWPREPIDLKNKRIAVVGAGASGIQVVQASKDDCASITHFIRKPIYAFPMRQRSVGEEDIDAQRPLMPHLFQTCRESRTGLPIQNTGKRMCEDTPSQIQAVLEKLWSLGGWHFLQGSYIDCMTDRKVNQEMYKFWCDKTRERIQDPIKREVLAPLEAPYYLGAKRPGLEECYYDACNSPKVEVSNSPIMEFTRNSIITQDGTVRVFDIVVLCTGYDAVDGPLRSVRFEGRDSMTLAWKWRNGIVTALGLMTNGLPNVFFLYGPQAPTSSASAPIFAEKQCEFLRDILVKMRAEKLRTIQPSRRAEEAWRKEVSSAMSRTLIPTSNSWVMGANIPGKQREALIYYGGMPAYFEHCQRAINDWKDFEVCT